MYTVSTLFRFRFFIQNWETTVTPYREVGQTWLPDQLLLQCVLKTTTNLKSNGPSTVQNNNINLRCFCCCFCPTRKVLASCLLCLWLKKRKKKKKGACLSEYNNLFLVPRLLWINRDSFCHGCFDEKYSEAEEASAGSRRLLPLVLARMQPTYS